ncbi:recombinase family protein [Bacteroides sp.]|uniref:recombinase family protein n=1 Tax=Bacteroides sp. TaxID=29523 RepID=UPI002603948D|nr:recombinase family protein [Bacteroides sp.]MDD3041194.1 recombinase family protein [Bacteroides sp.]
MRPLEPPYTQEEIRNLHLKGAIYIRMSTEMQTESPENQEHQIRTYAEQYGIEIVKIYSDLGISGMTAEKREKFQSLIDDVEQGRNEYNVVLYLDESRWGRFVDSREAEYHRMRLERKNVICQSCEKPLAFTSNIADRIMTLLRDESASDYCRQLSQKVWVGQCNLVAKGFRQGGVAGFGLRRMLLDEAGQPKQELIMGQRKSLLAERVILVPGPEEERKIVLWMYDQFINGMNEAEIAASLNTQKLLNHFGRIWSRGTVSEVLTNEKYIGNNLFNRTSGKMKSKFKPNPESEWVRKEQAFEPVVDVKTFLTVQKIYKERSLKISNDELLHGLRNLYEQQGRLSALIIDEAEALPPSSIFRSRFGGLLKAYRMIGYTTERNYQYVIINRLLRELHAKTIIQVIDEVEKLSGRIISVDPDTDLIELNHKLYISVVISRCFTSKNGIRRWKIRFDSGLNPDVTIAVRMKACNESILDYYILPALEFSHCHLKLSEDNVGLLDSFRTDSLNYLLKLSVNIPLNKAVDSGTRKNHSYSS